jgi:predicted TIM-barrel fold metal-dependent hydrolase
VPLPIDTDWEDLNAVWIIDKKVRQAGANPTSMAKATAKPVSVPSQELADVDARLADLDTAGIEEQVLYPTLWLACLAEDPDLELALARSYNTYMAQQCGRAGGRLHYAAVIPVRRPAEAVAEIRRVREAGQAVSVFVRGVEWDMPLSHPALWPIYAEAERQDLAMGVHIGFGSPSINRLFDELPRLPGDQPFVKLPFVPARGFELAASLHAPFALASIYSSGVLDTFPKLRWVFLEAGATALLPIVEGLARVGMGRVQRHIEEGRIFAECEPDEDLPYLINRFGDDWLVAGSDMPHSDAFEHKRPEDEFRRRGNLTEPTLRKLLQDNARRLYAHPTP